MAPKAPFSHLLRHEHPGPERTTQRVYLGPQAHFVRVGAFSVRFAGNHRAIDRLPVRKLRIRIVRVHPPGRGPVVGLAAATRKAATASAAASARAIVTLAVGCRGSKTIIPIFLPQIAELRDETERPYRLGADANREAEAERKRSSLF
jgi:hypothetical protein